jgi:hypothetical protein
LYTRLGRPLGTEAYPHVAKASDARSVAVAATITTGAASEAYLNGALARLEATDPWECARRRAAIRRKLLALALKRDGGGGDRAAVGGW